MKRLDQVRNCYNQTADAYAEQFSQELDGKPLDRLLLQQFARTNAGKGLLGDLGCGPGHTTAFLHHHGVREILGIDLSAEMVRVASQHNQPLKFTEGNMLALDFADEHFGSFVAMYAIVHFHEEEIALFAKEMFRLLKPAGQILFSFHVGEETRALDEFLGKKLEVEFQFFLPDQVINLFEAAGFRRLDALVRYPYEGKEYPSRRAYLWFEKPTKA